MFGILNINKPQGITSRAVVTQVSRIVGRKVKCGHAGTLDPLATGVLLVCVGKATKLGPLIHEHSKSYAGTFLLGKKSETDDIEGEVESVAVPDGLDEESLRELLPEFTGRITQVPPTHSAIWIDGKRAYDRARNGEDIEMPEREVHIESLELTNLDRESFSVEMTCGTGTYVRSIGRDLARKAGTAAIMSVLTRTSIGPFSLENAVELEALNRENILECLQNPLAMLAHLPEYQVTAPQEKTLRYGQRIDLKGDSQTKINENDTIVVTDGNQRMIAIAARRDNQLAPQIVFPESSS